MPEIEEYCEVRTTGGVYRDWMMVSVNQNILTENWIRRFSLRCAEPGKGELRLKPEDRVDIALAGEVIISGGMISDRQGSIDANRHVIQVDGCSKAGPITHASIDMLGGQFRGYKIDAIANTVLKPFGLKFRVENGPAGWDEKFPNVAIRHGETPFALLKRLCWQRGLLMRAEPNGDIVAGAKALGGRVVFEEGVNILSATCHIKAPWVESVVGRAQQPGSDNLFGKNASEISAKATLPGGGGRKRIVLAEMPLSQKELQLRTNMEMQAIQASLIQVTVNYKGWLKPSIGGLWDLTDGATVRSKSLFPIVEGNSLDLRLAGVSYSQDLEAGSTTQVLLVNDAAFGISGVNAKAPGPFNSPGTQAQPEQST